MAWSEDEKKVICQDGFAVVTVYLEILDKHTNRFHRMTVYMCCMNGSYRVTTLNFTTLTQWLWGDHYTSVVEKGKEIQAEGEREFQIVKEEMKYSFTFVEF